MYSYTIILFFFFLVVVFLLWITLKWFRDSYNWYKVDYFVYGVTALSLIAAAGQIRMLYSDRGQAVSSAKDRYELSIRVVRDLGHTYYDLHKSLSIPLPEGENDQQRSIRQAVVKALPWFSTADSLLSNNPDTCLWHAVLNMSPIDDSGLIPISAPARQILSACSRIENHYQQLLTEIEKSKPTLVEDTLTLIYPYPRAVALALKVTHVTAERRGYSKTRSRLRRWRRLAKGISSQNLGGKMGRSFSDTLDQVESHHITMLQTNLPEYIKFWEEHIGYRDLSTSNDLLKPYKLVKVADGTDAGSQQTIAHDHIAMHHYSQFLHLLGANREVEALKKITSSTHPDIWQRQLELWYKLASIYMHLDGALELEYELWDLLREFQTGSSFSPSTSQRNKKMKEVLKAFAHAQFDADVDDVFDKVGAVRHFIIHRTRFASEVDNSNVWFFFPKKTMAKKDDTPSWEDQIKNFSKEDCAVRAKNDFEAVSNLLNKLRIEFRKDLTGLVKAAGLNYAQTNIQYVLVNSPTTQPEQANQVQIVTYAYGSGNQYVAPSGVLVLAPGTGSLGPHPRT